MAMLGQASGGFTESSSSLRLLHVGIRNSTGVLADDAFTQTNPHGTAQISSAVLATYSTASPQVATSVLGVLSGSVAFTRGDAAGGNNEIGGVVGDPTALRGYALGGGVIPLGVFINHAAGYSFENTPALSSSKSPYVSAQGTYANSLYETVDPTSGAVTVPYAVGDRLAPSINGFLISEDNVNSAADDLFGGTVGRFTMAFLKMTADSAQDEIMYDQRI